MRTTLTIDEDLALELERRRKERGTSLKEEVNHLLRAGLLQDGEQAPPREPFRTKTANLGRALFPIDDVEAAVEYAEGPWHT